ncbi:MAG TPA: hypothetical protein V6D05_03390, partial [Stenomitos sp.]
SAGRQAPAHTGFSPLSFLPATNAASPSLGVDRMSLGGTVRRLFSRDPEVKHPDAFALTPEEDAFREAVQATLEPQRRRLADAILHDSDVMANLNRWETLDSATQLATLRRVADLQGRVMGFTPPAFDTKPGIPSNGTLGYFAPSNNSVTVYPEAMAKAGKWAPFVTIVHEMEHAHQFAMIQQAKAQPPKQGTPESTVVSGFAQSMRINEKGLEYQDYAHLNVEFDAFQTGNQVAAIVSHGQADTRFLGTVDEQYDARGNARLDLEALEQQVGVKNLRQAVVQEQEKFLRQTPAPSGDPVIA